MKSSPKIQVSIIILSYNTKDILTKCLQAIPENENYEIIVIDNGSTDGSAETVRKFQSANWRTEPQISNIKLIKNKKNLGFAKGNNTAKKITNFV